MERGGPHGKSPEEAALEAFGADYLDELPEWIDEESTPSSGIGWVDILRHWDAIVTDFQEIYGISLTPTFLATVSWRPWFTSRIVGLLTRPSEFMQQDLGTKTRIVTIPSTRLGMALMPPNFNPDK